LSKYEELSILLERSRRFYESAIIQIEKGFYDLAAFSPEQSLQLFLKAYLLKLGVDYPRTHSSRKLLEMIYEITKFEVIKELVQKFSIELAFLEDIYITSRYISREFTLNEVSRLKKVIDEVIEVVREVLDKRS
jgi:HEPN domain-containing protein